MAMETHPLLLEGDRGLSVIVAPLLGWYKSHARRLPWRENRQPYPVWVSEIMLQQTRVEAVIPYFERFMAELPTIEALARAKEGALLKLWEGLGYYSRVKNMQKAAKIICQEHGGQFPHEYKAILGLPGIGPYTAGAIASIAFGQPRAAVDGNVLRLVARLTEDGRDITEAGVRNQVAAALEAIYPAGACGDFTQSLMELGAVICLPNGVPKCERCPLKDCCKARTNNTWQNFPVKKKKAARRIEEKTVFLLCHRGKWAVCRRQEKGLLGGLWEFPNLEGHLTAQKAEEWLADQGILALSLQPGPARTHIFTHVEWHMNSYLAECGNQADCFTWADRARLDGELPLPTAFKKFL